MKEDLSLVEQAQQDILNYISNNSNCKKLPKEQELVEELCVSRVVVREALSRLRAMGFIETKRKKGTVVVVPEVFGTMKAIVSSGLLDKDTLRDLYQLRIMLEIGMADYLYQNKTNEQMEKMESIIRDEYELDTRMASATDDGERYEIAKELTDIDIRFHSLLFEMTGNKSLIDFQYILRHLFTLYFPKVKRDPKEMNIVSHIGLFNLLRTGTPDAFRTAMRLHLNTQIVCQELNLERKFHQK